ncbi:MAG TPA: hypothetical protein PKD53_00425 [Chloroflexaceae bacterium]|nr:hypothetical protein [Chloroflexaceae bacterium]
MRPRFLLPARLLEADGGAQGGAGGQQQQQQDPAEGLRNALQRANNDAMALAAQLYSENYQLRDRNRQLSAQAPAEGSVVLTREQAAQWTAYQQLGADPAALATQLQGAQQAQQQLVSLQRQQLIGQVAEAAGYKAAVLGQLPGSADLAFELRDVTVDGKAVKQAFVKPRDGEAVALSAYARQHWADFLPALAAGQQQQTQGTPFPGQQPGGATPPADPVAAFAQRAQQQRDAAPNPLKK